jgi:signal transduction histidine kinase
MSGAPVSERFTTRWHRSTYILGYLLIFGVALRRINELDGAFSIGLALALLVSFAVLYASERALLQRFKMYPRVYFAVQMMIALLLGFFEIYIDTWAVLFIVLGLQVAVRCSRKEALVFWGLFIGLILGTLFFEFGVLSGLGRAMAYIVIGIFFISFDNQYAQREDAQAESQVLLEELQAAHQKLKEQATQAEQLAAIKERSRITQEIHDAVGQKVFAIQLMTETTCAWLEKDPPRAADQLDLLQEQTQAALGQMRQLISRWRSSALASPPEDGGAVGPPPSAG